MIAVVSEGKGFSLSRRLAIANYRWRSLRRLNFDPIQNRNALCIFLNRRRFHDSLELLTDDRVQRFPALANLATYKLNW